MPRPQAFHPGRHPAWPASAAENSRRPSRTPHTAHRTPHTAHRTPHTRTQPASHPSDSPASRYPLPLVRPQTGIPVNPSMPLQDEPSRRTQRRAAPPSQVDGWRMVGSEASRGEPTGSPQPDAPESRMGTAPPILGPRPIPTPPSLHVRMEPSHARSTDGASHHFRSPGSSAASMRRDPGDIDTDSSPRFRRVPFARIDARSIGGRQVPAVASRSSAAHAAPSAGAWTTPLLFVPSRSLHVPRVSPPSHRRSS